MQMHTSACSTYSYIRDHCDYFIKLTKVPFKISIIKISTTRNCNVVSAHVTSTSVHVTP